MVRQRSKWLYPMLVVLFLLSFSVLFGQFGAPVVAEEVDAVQVQVEAPESVQPQATLPPATLPPPTVTPLPPAEIPEPITVILFGTGLAALSAAAARRKKAE